ncbi:ArgS-related anticodon-binding protein NrtL [Streptomyces catenulae]|uniref:arginine--tRNA ligase n=1 Tax=Streptomyces catenulae TaxID=66875 RepID=A0ABV2YVA5_9ACTN|nr:DALR anticodon-binding domain-containing protein [Streptomyces catenulae]
MTPAELSRTVLRSVRGAVAERELSVAVPERVVVRPAPHSGDYASNVALQLAAGAGLPAREVAEVLRRRLAGCPGIAYVEVAGPGFLNFTLGDGAPAELVRTVLAQGPRYGSGGARPGRPGAATAPPPGGARGLVVAEALARIDAAADAAGTPPEDAAPRPAADGDRAELARLVARLGGDEARWALLRPAAQDPVRPPERPTQREENPRFRVQYAYARTQALVRNARELGFTGAPGDTGPETHPGGDAAGSGTAASDTQALHLLLGGFPDAVAAAARYRAPDRVVRHLEALAEAYLRWQGGCRPLPVGEEKPSAVHRARVALAEATGTVLANGLRLLGVSAPVRL